MGLIRNPILPGCYPDPSICRVGERFYMVHSTFTYFPGIPIFESEDLAHWRQVGNVLDRDSQIPLAGKEHSQGIFAPTIRFHQGRFYVITTNMPDEGNFVVTAEDPAGPWSEPYYLGDGARGIDPSLFFDEDGSCWYIGQRGKREGRYDGDCEIWIQRMDLHTMQLEGPVTVVLDGFQKNAVWPEGPHLYRKDGYYYILHAESGTAFHHCVAVARSRRIEGPYVYCKSNPILTHRHLGQSYPVTSVGHGDLVEDGRGNWYMVMLACRPQDGYTLLGRETFLAKVSWEDDWPVVNPGVGRLEELVEIPGAQEPLLEKRRSYAFDGGALPLEFLTLRNRREAVLSLTERPGYVRLFMRRDTLCDRGEPAYLAVRQRYKEFETEAVFQVCFGREGGCAGIAMVQSNENHIRAEYFRDESGGGLRAVKVVQGTERELGRAAVCPAEERRLRLSVRGLRAELWYQAEEEWRLLAGGIGLKELSTEFSGGFVGCTVGMYASGCGRSSDGYADFKQFVCQ